MPLDPLAHGAVESGVSGTSSEGTDPRGIVADSRAFRASVRVGERLQARVVADPSGLEVAGRRIAADLPAGLQPGQIVRLRIETVEGNQITMRLERGSVNANVASPPSGVSVSDHAGRGPVAAPRAFVAPPQIAQAPPARFQMGSSDPAALVRALRLPPSVETLAAARLALSAPQRVSNALATFEATLPGIAEQRLDGLRALIAFVARIDPDAPVLAQRIAAYVDHVVIGPEAKIVAMLAARDAASRVAPNTVASASIVRAATLSVSLEHDLSSRILSLLEVPPVHAAEAFAPAAHAAVLALAGTRLATASALAQSPTTIAFSLPIAAGSGTLTAQLYIERDGGRGVAGEEPTNTGFRLGFRLPTRHLGTVAVDVRGHGRMLDIAVKTEAQGVSARFARVLDRLSRRLETLDYRVASSAVGAMESPEP